MLVSLSTDVGGNFMSIGTAAGVALMGLERSHSHRFARRCRNPARYSGETSRSKA